MSATADEYAALSRGASNCPPTALKTRRETVKTVKAQDIIETGEVVVAAEVER